jgi:siroheme synthase (precorrin-2 oxidase/ferrochelatase)
MLLDVTVRGKAVVVVGAGEPARSRAKMLASEGAHVTRFPPRGSKKSGTQAYSDPTQLIRRVRPALVFFTVPGYVPKPAVVRAAHSVGALVHVYDVPALSDFTMPSIGTAGAIRVAVSTAGQSPAMAALLRRRIERGIRPVDVAMVRLQGELRATILRSLPTHEARKRTIYRILRHREVGKLLRSGRYEAAVALARTVIRSSARGDQVAAGKG